MTTHRIKKNTLSSGAFRWVQDFYKAADGMNPNTFYSFLADNAYMQFGNASANNMADVKAYVGNFWKEIKGVNHNFINLLGTDDEMVLEAQIDYTRSDDKQVTVPCVTIIERTGEEKVQSMRIFIDLAPVLSPVAPEKLT